MIPAFPLRHPLSLSGLWGCPNQVRFSRTSPLRIHQQEKERSTPHVCGSDRGSELLPTRQYSFARPRSFLLAPDTYAVRVTGDFKAAPGLTTARNGLSAFGGFARLRLTHLPLSGESPTIHQQEARLGIFLAVVACPEQAANRASSWSRRQESNPRQADYRSAVLPLNYTGLERVGGIEPPSPAWKAGALPLSYTRIARPIPAGRSTFTSSLA